MGADESGPAGDQRGQAGGSPDLNRATSRRAQTGVVGNYALSVVAGLIVLIVVIGFYPKIIFDTTTDAVTSLVEMAFGTETTAAASTLVKGG